MKWYHLFLMALIIASTQRCANQISPNGGPKDTIPPSAIQFNPENNSKNFKGKIVSIDFDEPIKLKDQKEIIITPRPGKDITILAKNNTITIQPKLPWADSTTYSINFREAVQDITESNPARNLHLAFSTGPVIDSLSIEGTARYADKETVFEKATVAVYQTDTFNIFKHQPSYITETNKEGRFKITNLKPGKYRIYAFDDKNKNLKVDSQTELYGFNPDTITLTKNLEKLNIHMVRIDSRKLRVSNVRHNIKLSKIKFNKGTVSYKIIEPEGTKPLNNYGDNQAEVDVYHSPELTDSLALNLTAIDSLGETLDTTVYIKATTAKTLKETFSVTIASASIAYETGQINVKIKYTLPLKQISHDTIQITMDSANVLRIYPEDITVDTAKKESTFNCAFNKALLQELTGPLQLYISKGVFISIEDDSSKMMKANIQFLKEEETGTLSLDVQTQATDYIIQIVTKDYKVQQQISKARKITFKDLPAGEYKIRAIIDINKNGMWDMGNIYKNTPPERIIYLRNIDKKYDFTLRANWETGPYTFRF